LKAGQPRSAGPEKPGRFILTLGKGFRREEESTVSDDRSVEEMANVVLMRQAKVYGRTGVVSSSKKRWRPF
jgi:hypothetical protein